MSLVSELMTQTVQDNGKVETLTENSKVQNPKQNLESKIESLIRSIENLTEKKIRIEFELKRQKKSLARKREELKRVSKSSQAKVNLSLESQTETNSSDEKSTEEFKRTQYLLQESAKILED